jgi:hypothetical protein
MSTILFSNNFIAKINAIIRKFWWAGIQEENNTNPIHFRPWEDICKPYDQGGLGIRDMGLINQSLIINSAWNLATNKNPLLFATIKAKYYPNHTFWTTPNPTFKSDYWSSIMQVQHNLYNNCRLQINNGMPNIWASPWTDNWQHIHDYLILPVVNPPLPSIVSQLWI